MTDEEKKISREAILDAIEFFGSSANLSRALKMSNTTISRWLNNKSIPSMASALKIQNITDGKVKREKLRPDIVW